MSQNQKALAIIFGGTGDLAYRKLYPALYKLYQKNYLNENFAVIGTARRSWSDQHYRKVIVDSLTELSDSKQHAEEFASHFYYLSHDIDDSDNYHKLADLANKLDKQYELDGNRLFYLSVSPEFFAVIARHLKSEELLSTHGYNRLLIEKPFGTNLEESNNLNEDILKTFDENEIYRIDHYLGKEMIQSIPVLRFTNPLLKKIWNRHYISNIQITLAEDIGVEDRGGYYETSGALRDMVQNHILQIVSLLLMDEPQSFSSTALCQEKIKVLKELIPITDDNIDEHIVRGQYVQTDTQPDLSSYRFENEVDSQSSVETFVAGKLLSDNEMWQDTPIYFRTGKRMKAKKTQIDIVFKKEPSTIFSKLELEANVLSFQIGPDQKISLFLNNKEVGMDLTAEVIQLNYQEKRDIPDDYERLLLNAFEANKRSFVHAAEVAESWKLIDAIRNAWKNQLNPLHFYPIFTNGPSEADYLLEENGHRWIWN